MIGSFRKKGAELNYLKKGAELNYLKKGAELNYLTVCFSEGANHWTSFNEIEDKKEQNRCFFCFVLFFVLRMSCLLSLVVLAVAAQHAITMASCGLEGPVAGFGFEFLIR